MTFKPDLSTAEVHDENIKGPLKVRQEGIEKAGAFNDTLIVVSFMAQTMSSVSLLFKVQMTFF